jgi:hypothetical protein
MHKAAKELANCDWADISFTFVKSNEVSSVEKGGSIL